MTLSIDLTPTEQAQLAEAARLTGLEPAALAKKWMTERLPLAHTSLSGDSRATEQARVAAILAAQGSLAHVAVTADDLHRERQADKQGEKTYREDGQ